MESIMSGQGAVAAPKVSEENGPKVKSEHLDFNQIKKIAVQMHLTGNFRNKHIIQYIFEKTNCLVLPSVIASWIHRHYVIRMLQLPLFEDLLDFYEVRHTLDVKRPMRVTQTVKGYFQDAFTMQSMVYEDFPNTHEVGIHQMTTFFAKQHENNNRVCIISSTYKGLTQSHVYIDRCYLPAQSRACKLFSSWIHLPVSPMLI